MGRVSKRRDDFPENIKKILQERVGNRCSNPKCRCLTSGPNYHDEKATRIGVAAHITAASLGGPRYDPTLTSEQRKSIQNGIWLCQNCAKLVDSDPKNYPVELLLQWKAHAEELARDELEGNKIPNHLTLDGFYCPYCDTFVKKGNLVCKGCQAEVAYGSTAKEWEDDLKIGIGIGALVMLFVFAYLPNIISKIISIDIKHFWGLPIILVLITGALFSVIFGGCLAKEFDKRKKKKPPRFIRKMIT